MEQRSNLAFIGGAKATGLPQATANGEPVVFEQLQAVIDGLAPKDNVRVSTQVNTNLASPGATIDGITMAAGDRVLVRSQTAQTENGIYLWNGAAVAMTRTSDADNFAELESAKATVDEGTDAGKTFRQTQVNGAIGTNNVIWTLDGSAAGQATETASGIAEIATQAETDTGTDDLRFVTPLKLASYAGRAKRFSATFGDGTATQYDLTHNLATTDIDATIRKVSDGAMVNIDWRALDANTIRINSAGAIGANTLRCTVTA